MSLSSYVVAVIENTLWTSPVSVLPLWIEDIRARKILWVVVYSIKRHGYTGALRDCNSCVSQSILFDALSHDSEIEHEFQGDLFA